MAKPEAPTLQTEHLILRRRLEKDIPQMLDLFTNDEVRKYLGGYPPRDEHSMLKMVRSRRPVDWVAALASTDEYIGECMLCKVVDDYLGETGYYFRRDYWGMGYAAEAARAVMAYAQNTLHLKRLCATIDAENARSQTLIQRLGFTQVALLPEADLGGRVANVLYYTKLLSTREE